MSLDRGLTRPATSTRTDCNDSHASMVERGGFSRLRVVFSTDSMGIGGTELNALRVARELGRHNVELSVVCLTEPGELTESYERLGMQVSYLGIKSLYGLDSAAAMVETVRMLRVRRPHLVHAHDMYSNVFMACCALPPGMPTLVTSQRWDWEYPAFRYRILNRWAHGRASLVIANSRAIAAQVSSSAAIPASRVSVVPNFVDDNLLAAAAPAAGRRQLREILNLSGHELLVGCVARLHPVKDHPSLLRAFPEVLERFPSARLILIGDGPARNDLEDITRKLRIAASVHFLGQRTDGAALLAGCDVATLTSLQEGSPNVILEAMSAGVPVVATRVGGLADTVREGVTGLLVPAGSPGALGTALVRLLSDQPLRHSMGMQAREVVLKEHTATHAVATLLRQYASAIGVSDDSTLPEASRSRP